MNTPLVSVMMPVYNGLPLIKASIESLLRQTYANWECIIVNDGSTDGTREYLDALSDKRFRIHHFEKNKGRPYARQQALNMAQGKYLAMLDAGDLYAKNKLELQVTLLEQHPTISLVATGMCSFGTSTSILRYRGSKEQAILPFNGTTFPPHATCMLRTNRAKLFKYDPNMKLGQDKVFLSEYLSSTSYLVIPDMLYFYSEFDSVNKKKIIRTYFLKIKRYLKEKQYYFAFITSLKWLHITIASHFISIENIISKRGRELTQEELRLFNDECKSVLSMCI